MTQHIAGDNIFAINGKKSLISLLRMQCGVVVNTIGKGFNIGSGVWFKCTVVAGIYVIPNA